MKKTVLFASIIATLILSGCGSTQFQSRVISSYTQIKDKQQEIKNKQTKDGVTIEDKGTVQNLSTIVQVQSCRHGQLLTQIQTKCNYLGKCYKQRVPVMVNVNPLKGMYFRKVKIHNQTNHILYLNRTDAILVDAVGNEHEAKTKDSLQEHIESQWACQNVKQLTNSVSRLKVLGENARIRPGRNSEFLLPFTNTSLNIPGEWRLEIIDIPTKTDQAGRVLKKVTFEMPFSIKEKKIKIDYKKDGTFSRWKEIKRTPIK